jgi:uncharacterized protein Usg
LSRFAISARLVDDAPHKKPINTTGALHSVVKGLSPMSDMALQLRSYRLTTAHILYHLPDHPSVLQEFVWQNLDLAPQFPVLMKFLDFWQGQLDGKLHSVRVASCQLIKPAEVRHAQGRFLLN